MKVITNLVPREVIDGLTLTEKEREQFDYLDWDKIESGNDSASFFRYKDELYDLGEFMRLPRFIGDESIPEAKRRWDGYASDTYFSGTLVRYITDGYDNYVIVGRYSS